MSEKEFRVVFDCGNEKCKRQVVVPEVAEKDSLEEAKEELELLCESTEFLFQTCAYCGQTRRYYTADPALYIQGPKSPRPVSVGTVKY